MAYDIMQYDDRRDPKWGLPGDVRDNWNNPTIATFFADIMTPGLSQGEINQGRAMFEGAFESMMAGMVMPDELANASEAREEWAPGCEEEPDAPKCRLYIRVPKNDHKKRPLIMYFFAAGMGGKPEYFDTEIAQYARDLDAVVIAPHYRVHPENKQPAQLNDSHAAYNWAIAHADELGIDIDNVVCAGYSVGGLAAISLAMRLKRYGITVRGCEAIAPPVTDIAYGPASRITYDTENLGEFERIITWQSLYGINAGNPALAAEIVPGHADIDDLRGFCPVFMHVFESDPNRDEDLAFMNKCLAANVMSSIHLWPGTNHATMYSGPMYAYKGRFYEDVENDLRILITSDCRRPWSA